MKLIFSHGYAAPPCKYAHLIGAWESCGLTVIAPTHADAHAFDGLDRSERIARTREVLTTPHGLLERLKDISAILDCHDGESFILAGHSFGALAAMVAAGTTAEFQQFPRIQIEDSRVLGLIALSPMGIGDCGLVESSWDTLRRPVLSVIAEDDRGMWGQPPEYRLSLFNRTAHAQKRSVFVPGNHYSFMDESMFAVTAAVAQASTEWVHGLTFGTRSQTA